jgi:hypothetical protein
MLSVCFGSARSVLREAPMLRVLIADDQIPDEAVRDSDVLVWARGQYGTAHEGFIQAFGVMRQAVDILRDGCNLTVAREFRRALQSIRDEQFDVAIIDLGWAGDAQVPRQDERTAAWKLIDALQAEDAKHPERQPTAKIIYSSRFEVDPTLGHQAAEKGILPFCKPYGERHSLPLGDEPEKAVSRQERVRVASESLRAVVKFVEHLRGRDVQLLVNAASREMSRALKDQRDWHRMAMMTVAAGVVIILGGVITSLAGHVQAGVVSTLSGVVVALIPPLVFRRLDRANLEIKEAIANLEQALDNRTRRTN